MQRLVASPAFVLPDALRHVGEPSAWARMTRPGQAMHSFLESPFFDAEGHLWLSDVPYGRVFRVSPHGEWRIVHRIDGEPHAMRIADDGSHIAVDYRHGLIELTGDGTFRTLATGTAERPFLGLSDMCFGLDGSLWLTDSGRTSLSDPRGRLYRRSPDGKLRLVLDTIPYPNGVCVSSDGLWLYVAVTRANQVWRLSTVLPQDGPPMVGTFLQLSGGLGPDGLATNALGWIAVAQAQAGRAYVFDALGDPIAEIRLPDGLWTTSLAFHPDDPTRLYIVDAQTGTVYRINIPTEGAVA